MAGMKEQIKQLEGVNEDMLDETKRYVDLFPPFKLPPFVFASSFQEKIYIFL